ncbi:MAG: hypothetical protein HYW62_04715 [Candidatus Levybacteria bacterium]|nr:hypothetical protein [Candidatus Levybacteria bacterium]
MPTLNKAKKETQTILRWTGILLFIIFLFLLGIRSLTFIKDLFVPPPPPTASFGKLLPIPFPVKQKEAITYTLNTLTGFLPNFSDRAIVYKINPDQPTLLGLDKTREKVSNVDFTSQETQIAQDVYRWTDPGSDLQRRITINIFSSDFTVSSLFLTTPFLQTLTSSSEKDNAIDTAKSFLEDMSLFTEDLDEDKTKTSLYAVEAGILVPTSKIAGAKIIRVNFFQKDIDGLPIYYDKGVASTIDLFIGKTSNGLKVISAAYFHKNTSNESSTYAIKSAATAFDELKQGKGFVASKSIDVVEVAIKKVSLGYYAGELEQEFLMPVVIFEGDNDFVAYVSAVRDEWINN